MDLVHHEGHEVHEEVIKHLFLIYIFILRVLGGLNLQILVFANEDGIYMLIRSIKANPSGAGMNWFFKIASNRNYLVFVNYFSVSCVLNTKRYNYR